jgi:hypothetical protein
VWGNYLELGQRGAGERVHITYPLPTYEQAVTIGNPGYRQYDYRVTWKGDTVVHIEPVAADYSTGYSDFDERDVPIFYGEDGPGPLYERDHMLRDADPKSVRLAAIHEDAGDLDFWKVDGR